MESLDVLPATSVYLSGVQQTPVLMVCQSPGLGSSRMRAKGCRPTCLFGCPFAVIQGRIKRVNPPLGTFWKNMSAYTSGQVQRHGPTRLLQARKARLTFSAACSDDGRNDSPSEPVRIRTSPSRSVSRYLCPCSWIASISRRSSSGCQGPFRNPPATLLYQRLRQSLLLRPGSCAAMRFQSLIPPWFTVCTEH